MKQRITMDLFFYGIIAVILHYNCASGTFCWCQHLTGPGTRKICNEDGPPDTVLQVKNCSEKFNGCFTRYEGPDIENANLRDCYALDPKEEGCTTSAGETHCYCYGDFCNGEGLDLSTTETGEPTEETDPPPTVSCSSSASTDDSGGAGNGTNNNTQPNTAVTDIITSAVCSGYKSNVVFSLLHFLNMAVRIPDSNSK